MADGSQGGVGIRLFVAGKEVVTRAFSDVADSGKKMWAEIALGEKSANPAVKALSRASGEAQGAVKGLAANAGGAVNVLDAFGPAGVTAAAAIGAAALSFAEAKKAMDFADELDDTAKRLHVTTDQLQEYRYAVRLAGGEEKGADAALESFSQTLGKAQGGLEKSKKGFKELGFTDAQIKSFKSVDEALTAVTTRIGGLNSNQAKDAVINQLGLDGMKPMIEDGIGAMQRLRQEAHSVGIVMDADLVKRGADAHDKFETLAKVVDVQLKSAFVDLGPALVDLIGFAATLASKLADVVDGFKTIEHRRTALLEKERQDLGDARDEYVRTNNHGLGARQFRVDGYNRSIATIDAELAKRKADEAASAAALKPDGGNSLIDPNAGKKASQVAEHSAQMLAEAQAAELQAREQLTRDIREQAKLREQEIDAQADEKIRRIRADIKKGDTDAPAGEQAIGLIDKARDEQKAKVRRDAEEAVAAQELAQHKAVADAQAQEARARLALTKDIWAQADFARSEIDRQTRQRLDDLAADTNKDASHKAANDQQAAAIQAAADLQKQKVTSDAIHDAAMRELDQREALLNYTSQTASIQAALAKTTAERYAIELRDLERRQAEERDRARKELDAQVASGEKSRDRADAEFGALVDRQSAEQQQLRESAKQDYKDAILGAFEAARGGAKGLAEYFGERMRAKLLDAAADMLSNLLLGLGQWAQQSGSQAGGSGGNWVSTGLNIVSSFFGGGRAAGGPMSDGMWYRGGEHGQTELAMVGAQGYVADHAATVRMLRDAVGNAGGGGVVHLNLTQRFTIDGAVTAPMISEMINRANAQSAQAVLSQVRAGVRQTQFDIQMQEA